MIALKAPFPWFGGKARVAEFVWDRFGNVVNYVEPFFGSGAVLLSRPHEPVNETVNDLDCYLANFWRAVQSDPEAVARFADWPVNEADLHARHQWLVDRSDFRERMKTDPDYFDSKIAGWWVWGISMWIGSGWCSRPEWRGRSGVERADKGIHRSKLSRHTPLNGALWQTRPNLNGNGVHRKLPSVGRGGERGVIRKRPQAKRSGDGTTAKDITDRVRQLPDISGDQGASGRGIFTKYAGDLYGYMEAIAERMRRVRVCCGDWKRILGPSPTTCIGTTAVLLDPPYATLDRSSVYNQEDFNVGEEVRQWAIDNGDNPQLRIALCGYDDGRKMPPGWTELAWKANGGYGNQSGTTQGRKNASRERVWFSPHCLSFGPLFRGGEAATDLGVKSENGKEELTCEEFLEQPQPED